MYNGALAITGLTKRYRDFTLDNVSFSVPHGAVVGFIGENGTGKSTTLKTILGLVKKDDGTISILGKQDQDIDFVTRNKIGVVKGCFGVWQVKLPCSKYILFKVSMS